MSDPTTDGSPWVCDLECRMTHPKQLCDREMRERKGMIPMSDPTTDDLSKRLRSDAFSWRDMPKRRSWKPASHFTNITADLEVEAADRIDRQAETIGALRARETEKRARIDQQAKDIEFNESVYQENAAIHHLLLGQQHKEIRSLMRLCELNDIDPRAIHES